MADLGYLKEVFENLYSASEDMPPENLEDLRSDFRLLCRSLTIT